MIVVFDTNVLLAAIITEGTCAKLLHRARAGEFTLASCPVILGEIRRVLTKKFRLQPAEAASAMEPIAEAIGQLIEHSPKVTGVCRDADDDHIIACATASKADYLVTGDADLLDLKKYQAIMIISPRDFEAMFL